MTQELLLTFLKVEMETTLCYKPKISAIYIQHGRSVTDSMDTHYYGYLEKAIIPPPGLKCFQHFTYITGAVSVLTSFVRMI